jgi:superfamily II DNA or RNA helicase
MVNDFFDESILNSNKEIEQYPILKNFKDLTYVIKKQQKGYSFHVQIDEERLNSSEIKALLKYNENNKILSNDDQAVLNYLAHRLVGTITIYNVLADMGLILSYLKNSQFKIIFNNEEVNFSKDNFKLDINIHFDENNNIVLDVKNEGDYIFTKDAFYFISNNTFYELDSSIPTKFYLEIFKGNNKFSIESFFKLKESLLPKLKEIHNVSMDKDIENLENLNIEKKTAKVVAMISKTSYFIILELKYKIGDEFFNIEDYKYADTINWVDKDDRIKIVKEDGKLVQYLSDLNLSEDIFDEIFSGIRIRYSRNNKFPFMLTIPISNLELFVKKAIPILEKKFEVHYKDGVPLKVADGKVHFEVETNLRKSLNLLEFKVKFKIGDEYFDLDFLKELMEKPRKYVQLKDGTTVNIENIREINKWIEFLRKYEFSKSSDGVYKTQTKGALEIDEFLKDFRDKEVKSNTEYKNLILELKERKPVDKIELPKEVDNILRDYQKEGVYWINFLKKYGFGGILADEMGLGKTIQALTVVAMSKGKTNIVVCPKTLIYNWENEAKKYFPDLKVLIVNGDASKREKLIKSIKDENYDLVITSYSMLQKDYKIYLDEKLEFEWEILDEAHYVKNMKTLSAKAVRLIKANNRILLTGTPLENNLNELYAAFDLIMPGYLGSKLEFTREFVSKIERNNMIALELLQAKIRPFILRRTKEQVLKELPSKQEQVVYSEMTNKQVAIYNEVLNRVKTEVNELVKEKGFERSRIQILSALLKLRQVCNHPALVDDQFKNEEDISGKFNQFLELLTEVIESGEKVLVFSQFTSMLDIFERKLKEMDISYLRLDGSTKNRQELVDEFNNDSSKKVFLISLKAGGVGLNLTSASVVFLYDPWWNPMVEKQAMDRAHRIGQTKVVNVYKFITKNSIEEKILKLQERKGNLFENLVMEDNGFVKKLEWEDLMELFD